MNLTATLEAIARKYPPALIDNQVADIDRISFHIRLVQERTGPHATVCDLGGGIGLFSVGCAAVGMRATLVDDFNDPVNVNHGESVLALHRSFGVEVISRNVITEGLDFSPGAFDAITTFESMEHWHHSPKRLFASVTRLLRPGGLFVLSAPNCVSLRKRLSVPLGYGKWSQMRDWYEPEVFRGHTREPDVADLLYIAKDMGIEHVNILGRNWGGYSSARPLIRIATSLADRALRLRPSLCSDIYLLGRTRALGRP